MSGLATRLPDVPVGDYPEFDETAVHYWRSGGVWYVHLPGAGLGSLAKHQVIEHDDGTITVSPSILVRGGQAREAHGFLERGNWREA